MQNNVYFLVQVKHNKTSDVWEKGVVVKSTPENNNRDAALQGYHAYLGAYAYKHDPNTDYVYTEVIDAKTGLPIIKELWEEPSET